MSGRLVGRRVLITGASSGIGAATARTCLAEGAHVGVMARRYERLEGLVASAKGHATAVAVDLRDEGLAAAAVHELAGRLGGLDAVVNAAGLNRAGELSDSATGHWREMLETNLLAAFTVTQAALPYLTEHGGDVLNISSMSGRRALRSNSAVYAATKAALNSWSEALSWDLGPQGIRVMVLSPGLVRTEFADQVPNRAIREQLRQSLDDIGLAPDEVAEQIVHMLAQPRHLRLADVAIMPTAQRR